MVSKIKSLNTKSANYLSPSSMDHYISKERQEREAITEKYYSRMNNIRNKAKNSILRESKS